MSEITEWNGFKAESFVFEGKKAILVFPKVPDEKHNWLLKTEYWNAFPQREIDLLNRGFHLAWLQNETRFATRADCDRKAAFCDHLSRRYGLRNACVPVGLSCGGAHAVNFAGYYPDRVLCLYIDAPVLNFCSYPGKTGVPQLEEVWDREFTVAYPGIDRSGLLLLPDHPINRAETLLSHRISVAMAYGTMDTLVPYEENGKLLEAAYAKEPSLLLVMPRFLQGHHPHGDVRDVEKLLNFITDACR